MVLSSFYFNISLESMYVYMCNLVLLGEEYNYKSALFC